ncbi:MAG: hypothetical protein DRJ63_09540 [Thermoprotei archaeon]|nr:MAG: hypothetical protein DRJ63_09540 [Thermoprotei archaeon]
MFPYNTKQADKARSKINKKYRPSLTLGQLTKIVELAQAEEPKSIEAFQLIASLTPYVAKAMIGAVTPSYEAVSSEQKAQDKQEALNDSLGLETSKELSPKITANITSLPKESYWKLCYQKRERLGASMLSAEENLGAQEYAYLNDLMSAEEIEAFEQASFEQASDMNIKGDGSYEE